jgi:hypothetical protein
MRLAALPGGFDEPLAAAVGVGESALARLRAHWWIDPCSSSRLKAAHAALHAR